MKGIRLTMGAFDTKKQDAASGQDTSLEKADKAGYLYTYSGKTFLSREKWKKRYYVLTGNKLYRFVKKEDASLDLRCASRRRLINLDFYDICQLVNESESKREHAFLLDGANSSTDQTRYMFAAETKEDLQEWTSRLRKALLQTSNQRPSGRPQRPPRTKVSSLHLSTSTKSDGDASSEPPTPTRLYNPTKYRVRGPRGRRLPQKKNRRLRDANDKFISNSLCELDGSLSDEDIIIPTKSAQIRRSGAHSPPLGDRAKSNSSGHLAYQYSSSDESLLWKDCLKKPLEKSQELKAEVGNFKTEVDLKVEGVPKSSNKTCLVQEEYTVPARKAVLVPQKPGGGGATEDPDVEAGPGGSEGRGVPSPGSPKGGGGVGPLIYLSAKLLEMSGCLERFQRHAKEELESMRIHLADVRRRLTEYPPGTPPADIVACRARAILTDLKSTEEELETLVNVTDNMQKSLQKVKEKCDELLNTI